jgi:hypothetical protein
MAVVNTPSPHPGDRPGPEWQVLADATFAGLSPLVPLPFLDLVLEAYFRRRLPRTIARLRRVDVHPDLLAALGRGEPLLDLRGCLLVPFKLVVWVLKRIFRKLVYVLAVADAATKLGEYWHRAALVDHLMRSGVLEQDAVRALDLFARVLDEADTSPILGVAREMVATTHRALRMLLRARRDPDAPQTAVQERVLQANWGRVEQSFEEVRASFDAAWAVSEGSRFAG